MVEPTNARQSGVPTGGGLGGKYRHAIPETPNYGYKINRIINEHELHPDGSVKRTISLSIEAVSETVRSCYWHCPLPSFDSRITGVKLLSGDKIIGYELSTEGESVTISFALQGLKPGKRTSLSFEYYVSKAAEVASNGCLLRSMRYPFAYTAASTTEAFELRIKLPANARVSVDSTLPSHENFKTGGGQVIIASDESFRSGDITGEAVFSERTSSYLPVVSFGLGVLSTLAAAILRYGEQWIGLWYVAILPIVLAAMFWVASCLYREP